MTAKSGTVLVDDPTQAVLELSGIDAGYGATPVLRSVTIAVSPSTVVILLGANGAGKTTALRVAAGLLRPTSGTVSVRGHDVSGMPSHERVRRGVCLIPEGRAIFRSLTVKENLELHVASRASEHGAIEKACGVFPALGSRLRQTAGLLSGGEQQMLALARAYVTSPRVILLDEVSMGLAPMVVNQMFEFIRELASTGVALLLVEQYVDRALEMADSAYLMSRGRITWSGPSKSLERQAITDAYLSTDHHTHD